MTDEVTPTREQCAAWLTNAIKVERDGDVVLARCEADAILSHLRTPRVEAGDNYHDAYRGARDDLLDWKRRALEAEAALRQEQEITGNLSRALAEEVNSPAFMGEPVSRRPSEAVDTTRPAPSRRLTGADEFTLSEMLEWVSNTHASVAGYYFSNMRNGKGIKDQIAQHLRALASEDGAAVEPTTHNQP